MVHKTVFPWLIENGKEGEKIRYRAWKNGFSCWVVDPYEATWFVRRQDAESLCVEDEDAWRVVEHWFEEYYLNNKKTEKSHG